MNVLASRVSRMVIQITLLLALLGVGTFVLLRPYLSDDEGLYKQGRIDQVVSEGPVTIANVEWKLDSLKVYTKILNGDGEPIELDGPAGTVVVLATITVTPKPGLYLKDHGFTCDAVLRDDKGNTWKDQQAYGYPLPTYCGDSDHPFTMDKPAKIAKIFVVPRSDVPNLVGLTTEDFYVHKRVLITP
ncbi:hypothetical protein JOF29_004944 [Kribbella aluminosa]|uniref:DUF4352 domain-containing protein n=1 Tax=Kribbella aluminosa TaxID=416017 RepID=A0ABS4UQE9_9ACTN|nr:hypothetical protein [Kribbella aluminosa]MBP2353834.1 hypothetical protein [Kribbella aluminosa]